MKSHKLLFWVVFIMVLFLNTAVESQVSVQNTFPEQGIYDGTIEDSQIILAVENSDNETVKGYYVLNRGKAVEESHSFTLSKAGSRLVFQSDLYKGDMKSFQISPNNFSGTLALSNRRKIFFFWRQKVQLNFVRRSELVVTPSYRYRDEIFNDFEVKRDVLYGKAKGYWTRSPYSDDPYITTLSKGLIKSFSDPELLDLKMDIYYPKADVFKSRPLIMLIHGGAFYIGSKESAAEQKLASSFAKRGYVVASIDYRLGFKLLASDIELSAYRAVQDAHAALRFLAHNAKGLGIDPTQVYVGGTSAGGVASLSLAFMDNDERPFRIKEANKEGLVTRIEESGNKYPEKFEIKAVANFWGAVADLSIIGKDENIPVLSVHGTADDIVPYEADYPFKNSLMINRLIMDKMYGSKLIHDRLNSFGVRNRLVSLKGLGHEPELEDYKTLNSWMDTITSYSAKFLYETTAPEVKLSPKQLSFSEVSDLKQIDFEVNNGSLVEVLATGGLKTNTDPTDASIIWLKSAENKKLTIITTNKFEAWNAKSFRVLVKK